MSGWRTSDELGVIAGLSRLKPIQRRRQALEGYLAAAQKRDYWGNLDKAACIDFASKELAKIGEPQE